ncbi:ATP-binding protein [Sulfurimonas sp. MAG313]|nr:ATP-binding protein [Sulfurimonas sp. MAG313]
MSVSFQRSEDLFKLPLHELVGLYSIDYYDKKSYRVSSMLVNEDDNVKTFIQLARKKVSSSPYLDNLLLQLVFSVPMIVLFLLIITNRLLKRSIQSFEITVDAVNKLSAHDLKKRLVSDNAPLEIRVLINTFNALLQRLEESFNRISSFSADASHELKTPLTVILGEAEVGLRKERTPLEYQTILHDIIEEGQYVKEIIDQLFFLARKDTQAFTRSFQELYLDELLLDVVEQAQAIAKIKSINLYLENINPVTILANEVLLKTALLNLVKNAITYSSKGSEVKISLYNDNKAFVVEIKDNGCGISADALSYIFERFYRVDKSRSRKEGRTGLGLSIVKTILDIHHYSISIESELEKGTTAKIRFPNLLRDIG